METLIVMAKAPRAGSAKTRLQPAVSATDAATLAAAFLNDTLELAGRWQRQQVAADPNRRVVLYGDAGPDDGQLQQAADRCGARLVPQVGATLGERMA